MSRPWTIVMDLTERCNLRCVMCYFSVVDRLRFEPFDRPVSDNGQMPVETFERLAETFFPRAREVALGCAAEPLIHKEFARLVRTAGRYRVPELWFPTNLLALDRRKAEAIVEAGVAHVGVSVDGTDAPTYERIRVGGRFAVLEEKLALLNEVRRGSPTALRIIFTWMKSNRADLAHLPAFAAKHGAAELDVRFVAPTVGVDNSGELLTGEDPEQLNDELFRVFEAAVARGLALRAFPDFHAGRGAPRGVVARWRRFRLRRRAGMYRAELLGHELARRRDGCQYPGRQYVIRPNGAVTPCVFWKQAPHGLLPEDSLATIDGRIARLREGLRSGHPLGSCADCGERRAAFYRPLLRPGARRAAAAGDDASPGVAPQPAPVPAPDTPPIPPPVTPPDRP